MTSKSWRGVTELDHIPQLAVAARLGQPARWQAAICTTGIVCMAAISMLCSCCVTLCSWQGWVFCIHVLVSLQGILALCSWTHTASCDVCAEHPCSQIAEGDVFPIVTQSHQTPNVALQA